MKILVVSDTHGMDERFYQAYELEKPVDLVIHAGDTQGSEDDFERRIDCPLAAVAGNNDFFSMLPKEREFGYGGKRFFVTHGHYYSVASGYHRVLEEAKIRGCDFAIYGHTHVPEYRFKDGVHVINPGSLAFPRQYGRKPSYAIIDIDANGEVIVELKEMEK